MKVQRKPERWLVQVPAREPDELNSILRTHAGRGTDSHKMSPDLSKHTVVQTPWHTYTYTHEKRLYISTEAQSLKQISQSLSVAQTRNLKETHFNTTGRVRTQRLGPAFSEVNGHGHTRLGFCMSRMEAVSCAVSHTLLRAVHMDLGKDPMDSKSRKRFCDYHCY